MNASGAEYADKAITAIVMIIGYLELNSTAKKNCL